MNRIAIIFAALACVASPAFAGCESQTATLNDSTVVFQCPEEQFVDQSTDAPAPANVSVVEKAPDPAAAMPPPAPSAESASVNEVDARTVATKSSGTKPQKVRQASTRTGKKATRPAKSKKVKIASRKSTSQKAARTIHLEKPSVGTRIKQFFGM